jgi:hypothetical protein
MHSELNVIPKSTHCVSLSPGLPPCLCFKHKRTTFNVVELLNNNLHAVTVYEIRQRQNLCPWNTSTTFSTPVPHASHRTRQWWFMARWRKETRQYFIHVVKCPELTLYLSIPVMSTRKYNLLLDVHFLTSNLFWKEYAGHEMYITAVYKFSLETSACSKFHCNLLPYT